MVPQKPGKLCPNVQLFSAPYNSPCVVTSCWNPSSSHTLEQMSIWFFSTETQFWEKSLSLWVITIFAPKWQPFLYLIFSCKNSKVFDDTWIFGQKTDLLPQCAHHHHHSLSSILTLSFSSFFFWHPLLTLNIPPKETQRSRTALEHGLVSIWSKRNQECIEFGRQRVFLCAFFLALKNQIYFSVF